MDISLEEICQSISLEEFKINCNLNLSSQCDICYSNHNDLFDISKANFKGVDFLEIIEYFPCLKEHRDIENSFTLCTICVTQLICSYLFMNKIQMSNIKFEQQPTGEAIDEFNSKVCLESLNSGFDSGSSEDNKKYVAEQVTNDCKEHVNIIHDHDYIQISDAEAEETENMNDVEYIGNDENFVVIQEENFGCYECGKEFAKKQSMRNHIKRIHLKERRFQCQECGKQFFLKHEYNRHMALHRGEASFVCNICDRGYATAACLHNHMYVVHREKNLKCEHCPKMFKTPFHLKMHIRNVHSLTVDQEDVPASLKKIECEVCGKRVTKHLVKYHMETHTRARKYQCDVCGAKFFQQIILKGHMLRHQEPRFSCDYCEKPCFTRGEKLAHTRRKHTREIVCTCQFCGEGFVHSYNLLRHIRSRHKDNV